MMLAAMVMLLAVGFGTMALSASAEIPRKEAGLQSYPVGDAETIYKGALVCLDTPGYLVPAADTAGLRFAGVAYEKIDNSAGADGAKSCRVYTEGTFKITATSITQAMVGAIMYVASDAAFDDASTNFIPCGVLVEYVSTTSGWIQIDRAVEGAAVGSDSLDSRHYIADSIDKEHIGSDIYTIEHITFTSDGAFDNTTIKLARVWSDCTVIRITYFTSQALGTSLGLDVLDGGAAGSGTDVIDSCSDDLSGLDSNDLSTPYALSAGDYICVKADNIAASTIVTIDIQLKVPVGSAT